MGKNICEPFYMTNLVDWRVRSAIALGSNMFGNANESGFCAKVHIFCQVQQFWSSINLDIKEKNRPKINGNFRILKWRYVSTIFWAIFWGYIPLHRPYIGLMVGS